MAPLHAAAAAGRDDMIDATRRRQTLVDFAVSHSRVIFYIAELHGDKPVSFISDNVETITGHKVAEFHADRRYGRRFIHPDDLDRYTAEMARLGEVESVSVRYRFRTLDNEWLWFNDDVRLLPEEGDGPREFVASMTDVTALVEAEQALRRTQALQHAVVESSRHGIVLADDQGNAVSFNAAALELFDYTEQDIAGRPVGDLIVPPHLRETHRQGFERYRTNGDLSMAGRRIETEAMRRDGSTFPVELSFARVAVDGNTRFVAEIRDITERVEAERRSHKLAQLLQDAVDSLPHGFSVVDRKGYYEICNRAFADHYGCTPDQLIGRHRSEVIDFLMPQIDLIDGDRVTDAVQVMEILERSRERPVEVRMKSGTWWLVTRQTTTDGRVTSLRSDITQLKQAQEAVSASNAFITRLLDACPVPFGMSRMHDSLVLYESPASKALYQRDFSSGPVHAANNFANPEDRTLYVDLLKSEGYVESFQTMLRRNDGTEFPGSLSGRLIEYDGEQVIVFASTDLTRQLEIEAEMTRQREALHQGEKLSALGELLSGIAHELNNPLSVLVGQALLLKETAQDTRVQERAAKIGAAADRCARIVKSFLAMARQRPMRNVEIDLNVLIGDVLELMSYALRASNIAIELRLSEKLPAINGDPDQLQQILINLVVNAQHALDEVPEPRVLRIITAFRSRDREVVLKVKDNGPGMHEQVRRRVFEPLFTTKEIGAGTGIGLALCHRIVTSHGGRIKVESAPDEGATFILRLPAARPVEEENDEAEFSAVAGSGRVLVVDDEIEVGELVAEILTRDGYQVTSAQSGEEALGLIRTRRFEAIVSDLRMPGMDGMELHARISEMAPQLLPSLGFMTGDTMGARAHAFLEATGAPYIDKPILPDDLRGLLARLTGADKMEQAGS